MSRGFYAAVSAMQTHSEQLDVIANNLANVNTHGFKRSQHIQHDFRRGFLARADATRLLLERNNQGLLQADFQEARTRGIGELGTGTLNTRSWSDFKDGALEKTEAPLDLALQGEGFFVLQTPEGEQYTRHGAFQLNEQGQLVTADGMAVQGQQGDILLETGSSVTIDAQGIIYQNGQQVDQLQLVKFENPQLLVNVGNNRLSRLPEQEVLADESSQVHQHFLERSNVDVATEMVGMISALRAYQFAQKALQSEDELTGKLSNEISRI